MKLIIEVDKIITGDGATVLNNTAIFIDEKGLIGKIGSAEQLKKLYPQECVQEYKDATLLPGLIDMHVHIGYWWTKPDYSEYNDFMIAYMALKNSQSTFKAGVTTIRDVASPEHLCISMKKAASRGFIQIPRIIDSGAGICMTGGHGWQLKGGIKEVNGPWEIRKTVREQIKNGAQWIKILSSHRSNTPEFTQEELNVAVDEAHRVGVKIAVHSGTQPSIQMCIDAGFDTIEHGTYLTVDQAQQMKEKNIVWVPTIIAYTGIYEYLKAYAGKGATGNVMVDGAIKDYEYYKSAAEAYRDNFGKLIKTGVKTIAGTDLVADGAPITPVALEMKYMVNYGMEPLEAIKAATSASAEVLGMSDKIGLIKEGLIADLLIVEGDPLKDIASMSNIAEVYYGGKSVYKKL
ncbi:amidohydrolase family protein [Clostridium sp. 19966]|nr:amidohydrolase family protein [Clostridium sp. 19966]